MVVAAQRFQRLDLLAVQGLHVQQAGFGRNAVQQHGAHAAIPLAAAGFDAFQPGGIAQEIQQDLFGRYVPGLGLAVKGKRNGDLFRLGSLFHHFYLLLRISR